MAINIGKLNKRVMFQVPSKVKDAIGQPVVAWVDFRPLWADIRLKNGLETIKADKPGSKVQASIRVRYRTDIVAGMRGLYKGVVYSIVAVLPDVAGQEYTDLVCEVGP